MAKVISIKVKKDVEKKLNCEEVIREYTPLVRSIARKIALRVPRNINLEDLISCGTLGLIDAIEKYDYERDNNFRTYAEFRIRGAILDELRSLDWLPRSIRDGGKRLERVRGRLRQDLGRDPKKEEIAEAMNVSIKKVEDLMNQICSVTVLCIDEESSFTKNDKRSILNLLERSASSNPSSVLEGIELKKEIYDIVEDLPEKQKHVILLYYYEGWSFREIGRFLKVTESRVSQLHTQGLHRLKTRMSEAA